MHIYNLTLKRDNFLSECDDFVTEAQTFERCAIYIYMYICICVYIYIALYIISHPRAR